MRLWKVGFRYVACGVLALGCPAGILAQGGQQTVARDAQLVGASHDQAVPSIVGADQSNRPRFGSAIEETASAELPTVPVKCNRSVRLPLNPRAVPRNRPL